MEFQECSTNIRQIMNISMKAALITHQIYSNPLVNFDVILGMAEKAVHSGAELILFSEAAVTGLVNDDNPKHDLSLGEEIPGPVTTVLSQFCIKNQVWLGIGLFERSEDGLYDSAILIAPDGNIALKYRRIQPHWHGNVNPAVYHQGSEISVAQTPFGSIAFLLCGDLFDDAIVYRLRALQVDWLLFPFARSFDDYSWDQNRWDQYELPQYLLRVRMANTSTLMVNHLSNIQNDCSFGGAFFVSKEGKLLSSLPLGKEGILIVEM